MWDKVRNELVGEIRLYYPCKTKLSPHSLNQACLVADVGALQVSNARVHQQVAEQGRLFEKLSLWAAHNFRNAAVTQGGFARQTLQLGEAVSDAQGVLSGGKSMAADDLARLAQTLGEIPRNAEVVVGEALRTEALVGRVDDIARIIRCAPLPYEMGEVDVAGVLKSAVDEARAAAEKSGLKLSLDVDSDLPRIRADSSRIRQVFADVLDNAFENTTEGEISVKAAKSVGGQVAVAVSISDTGKGIAAEDQARVFDLFTQVGSGAKQGASLFLAKHVVEDHGGSILLESEPGKGTTFTLTLPAAVTQTLDVSPVLTKVSEGVAPVFSRWGVNVTSEIPCEPVVAATTEQDLMTVMQPALKICSHFHPDSEAGQSILVGLRQEPGAAVVTLTHDGQALSDEFIQKIRDEPGGDEDPNIRFKRAMWGLQRACRAVGYALEVDGPEKQIRLRIPKP